jgi:hypothetical protein
MAAAYWSCWAFFAAALAVAAGDVEVETAVAGFAAQGLE